MSPRVLPVANLSELKKIRDLAGDLSSAMALIDMERSGLTKQNWYHVNRVLREASALAERLERR